MRITKRAYQQVDIELTPMDADVLARMADQAARIVSDESDEYARLAMFFELLAEVLWADADARSNLSRWIDAEKSTPAA